MKWTPFLIAVATASSLGGAESAARKPPVQGYAVQRVAENLDRGIVAIRQGSGVYVSWRLLRADGPAAAFDVRRVGPDGRAGAPINPRPLGQTTDYLDAAPPGGDWRYTVTRADHGGADPAPATPAVVQETPYRAIRLQGSHQFYKVAVADLDGDGRLDFVVKQPQGNVDPYDRYWKKSEDTYKLEAYTHDGRFLWRYDMGWAIEQGTWYAPYLAYDFDGDGRAEVAVKAGEGDPRDPDGRVTTGPEYLALLDGRTGRVVARLDWPDRSGFPNYNYYCRNQLSMAYLDGRTPCLLVQRGTYNTIKLIAYDYHRGALRKLWNWEDTQEAGGGYRGQGAHCLRAADIELWLDSWQVAAGDPVQRALEQALTETRASVVFIGTFLTRASFPGLAAYIGTNLGGHNLDCVILRLRIEHVIDALVIDADEHARDVAAACVVEICA